MEIVQICLDVDGVLADFVTAAIELHGGDVPTIVNEMTTTQQRDITKALDITPTQFWKNINEAGHEFWENLEPYPWAMELWYHCTKIASTTLCTSPSLHPTSVYGKVLWIKKHFGDSFEDFHIGSKKNFLARPGAVLIDDFAKNTKSFMGSGSGATSILFPQPWNNNSKYTNPLEYTKTCLQHITER